VVRLERPANLVREEHPVTHAFDAEEVASFPAVLERVTRLLGKRAGLAPDELVEPVETVDRDRFRGTCYRAANWIHVGETQGRGRLDRQHSGLSTVKDIYLYPLRKDFRQKLHTTQCLRD
jgi:hypothetical protein